MSRDAAQVQIDVEQALRDDAPLAALFLAQTLKLYDVPPTNTPPDYLTFGEDGIDDISGGGVSLSEIAATVHVWSLSDPPGKLRAKRIGDRVETVLRAMATPNGAYRSAWLMRTTYVIDPVDNATCHGIITVGLSREAA